MPAKLTRLTTPRGDALRLTGDDYAVEVTIDVQGLELDATTVERALHATLAVMAERGKLRIDSVAVGVQG